jgi:outer membrane immunogenic protein
MRNSVSYLALGVGLTVGSLNAQGQTPAPTFVAQAPVPVPPSGVLEAQPPAPVAVPPSGVLVTQPQTKRRTVATGPINRVQTAEAIEKTAPTTMRRHVRRATTKAAAVRMPAVATTTAATPASSSLPIYMPAAAQPYNWTGFYIGGNLGFGWNAGSFADPLGNTLTPTNSSQFLAGSQLGLNYQFWGSVLIGVEASFDWLPNANNTGSAVLLANPPGVLTGSTASVTVNNRWLTTVTGRLGYAWDRVLLYGKGGGAWVGSNNPAIRIDGGPFPVSTSNSNVGWIAGLGVEWTFWENWSARLEYDFVGLNGATLSFPTALGGLPGGDQFSGNNRSIQVGNVGINYEFGSLW